MTHPQSGESVAARLNNLVCEEAESTRWTTATRHTTARVNCLCFAPLSRQSI